MRYRMQYEEYDPSDDEAPVEAEVHSHPIGLLPVMIVVYSVLYSAHQLQKR